MSVIGTDCSTFGTETRSLEAISQLAARQMKPQLLNVSFLSLLSLRVLGLRRQALDETHDCDDAVGFI